MDISQKNAEQAGPSEVACNDEAGVPTTELANIIVADFGADGPDVLTAAALARGPQHADAEVETVIRRDERGRIARQIHHSTSTLLEVLDVQVSLLQQSFLSTNAYVRQILVELGETVSELHDEVWAIGGSNDFDPQGLTQKLEAMTSEFARRAGCRIETRIGDLPVGASAKLAETLFRVAQEALANVSRHARAMSVSLSMATHGRLIILQIVDDGIGIDSAAAAKGRGISNMIARLRDLGGKLTIRNLDPGTMIEASVLAPA